MNTDRSIPALRALWKEAFGDSDSFLDAFFALAYSPSRCRCIREGDQIPAALYWFDAAWEDQRYAYLYAVATAPAHRGRGLCRRLMAESQAHLAKLGYDGLLLVPQTEALARMYEKMGYAPCTGIAQILCTAAGDSLPLAELDAESYAARRQALLPPGGVRQEGPALALLASQARLLGGDGFIAAVTVENAQLRCHEFLGDPALAPRLLSTLGIWEGSFRTPGDQRPFSWFLPLSGGAQAPGYFGLALD